MYNYYPEYQQMSMFQQPRNIPKRLYESVQGEAAADVFPVSAGQDVILFDEDNPYVYFKSRDLNNQLTKKRYRLVEEEDKPTEKQSISKEDIQQLISDAVRDEVERKLSEISFTPKTRKRGE